MIKRTVIGLAALLLSASAFAQNGGFTIPSGGGGGATLGTNTFTGPQTIPAGSATAPSLVIGPSSGGTGFYSVSTTGFGIALNGVALADFAITTPNTWTFSNAAVLSNITINNLFANNAIANTVVNTSGIGLYIGTGSTSGSSSGISLNGGGSGSFPIISGSYNGDTTISPMRQSSGDGNVNIETNSANQLIALSGGGIELPTIGTDSGNTDATICEDTTSHLLYYGSGTLGICLGTSSSIRFKDVWRPLENSGVGLVQVMALMPGTYFYKPGIGDGGKHEQFGFLAENYADVLPKLTRVDSEGKPDGIDMLGLVPILTRAIQEQQKEIEDLRHSIAELRK